MNDDDLDLDVEETDTAVEQEPARDASAYAERENAKLRKENQSLRQRLRRTELESKYDAGLVADIVELGLPVEKWAEAAERLSAKINVPASEPSPTEEVEQPEPPAVEVPAGLAAVARNSGSQGTAPPRPELSYKEIVAIGKSDNAEARRIIKAQFPQ